MAQAAVAVANGALLMHPSPAGVDERYEFLQWQKRPLPLSEYRTVGTPVVDRLFLVRTNYETV